VVSSSSEELDVAVGHKNRKINYKLPPKSPDYQATFLPEVEPSRSVMDFLPCRRRGQDIVF
jgi:hypothetical protein